MSIVHSQPFREKIWGGSEFSDDINNEQYVWFAFIKI